MNTNLTSFCATQKFSIVSKIYNIWSLDRQSYGKHNYEKVFLNTHMWSLDHQFDCQCCGKYGTRFSSIAMYGHWIVSVTEACDKVLLNGHGHLMTDK